MQGRSEPRGAQAVRFQCRRIIPYRPRFVRNCAAIHLAGTPCGQARTARHAMPAPQAASFRTRLRNAAGHGRGRRACVDRAASDSRACPYRRGHGAARHAPRRPPQGSGRRGLAFRAVRKPERRGLARRACRRDTQRPRSSVSR